MSTAEEKMAKAHLSVVVAGHVDAGKSTTTGRLIFELGGIDARTMEKLKEEADKQGKASFAFAFLMDKQKEERERGVTISCTTKEFFTENFHYSIIDAPGHRDFIKNMITGSSQADVAILMVPADGNFEAAIARGDHESKTVQGQTRQHARLLNLLGVKQLIVGINKMDEGTVAKYAESRYNEIRDEVRDCLTKTGWKKAYVDSRVPFIPISGWVGDNLLEKSDKMAWWKGVDLNVMGGGDKKVHVHTLVDALNDMVQLPDRTTEGTLRMPVSGNFTIKGVGTVITGRVERGAVKPGQEVAFLPTHTGPNPCIGKVFSVEMHHKSVEAAHPGDNVGLNVKNLDKLNMPKTGDVMVLKEDTSLASCKNFTVQVQILDHPGELKVGYTPVAYVRTARAPVKMIKINWHLGKSTGKQKVAHAEGAPIKHVKKNELAELVFEPTQPLCVEPFFLCDGLGRVAIMEGNSAVMLGKCCAVEYTNGTIIEAPKSAEPVAKAGAAKPKKAKKDKKEKKKGKKKKKK